MSGTTNPAQSASLAEANRHPARLCSSQGGAVSTAASLHISLLSRPLPACRCRGLIRHGMVRVCPRAVS